MRLALSGAFGAWRHWRRLRGWIARVRCGVNRVSLLISLCVPHACMCGKRWSVFQWSTFHHWPKCLRGTRIFTPVRAHARRMGRIKPLESTGGISAAAVAAGCVAKESFPLAVLLPHRVALRAKSAGQGTTAGVGVTVEAPPGALAGLGESERKPCPWRCSECALCVSWVVLSIPLLLNFLMFSMRT